MWNDDRIAYDTSTAFGANWFPIYPQKWEPVYRNGQRLKKGEQRPGPFWLDFVDMRLPKWDVIICKQIFRILIRGAYSRKYDKPRKFRRRRLF